MRKKEAIFAVWERLFFSDILDDYPDLGYSLYNMVRENDMYDQVAEMKNEAIRFTHEYWDDNECFPVNTWQGKIFEEVAK